MTSADSVIEVNGGFNDRPQVLFCLIPGVAECPVSRLRQKPRSLESRWSKLILERQSGVLMYMYTTSAHRYVEVLDLLALQRGISLSRPRRFPGYRTEGRFKEHNIGSRSEPKI